MTAARASGAAQVREAAEDDLAAIQRIYAHHVVHGLGTFEERPPDLAETRRRRQAVRAQGLPYLAAELEGEVVGFAYATPYRDRPAYRHTLEDSVYVAPAAQAQGVGRALLARLVELCAGLGFRQMVAIIGDSANAPSIALHVGLGFRRAGALESVGYKHGRWLDTVILQRALGPGDGTEPPA